MKTFLLFLLALVLAPASWEGAGAAEPAPAAATKVAPTCGSVVYRKANGKAWRCTFADEFNRARLGKSRWIRMTTDVTAWVNGPECYRHGDSTVRLEKGKLLLSARDEGADFLCNHIFGPLTTRYSGGSVTTYGKFSQTYGRFEFRVAFPRGRAPGVHSAVWLYPEKTEYNGLVPKSGEIDVAEFYTQYPDRAIPYLHYDGDLLDPNRTNNDCYVKKPWRFHTYVLVWTANSIRVTYDGKTCIHNSRWSPLLLKRPAPFDHPYMINLSQGLGILTNAFDPDSTKLPATMRVDYVRVWK